MDIVELPNDDISNNISDKGDNTSDNISDNKSDDKSDNKSEDKNECDEREAVRRQFYKNRIKKDNIKLEIDDSTPQEERRKRLLEHQKKHRDEAVNAARGIVQEYSKSKNESVGAGNHSWYYRVLPKESTINRMMLSEWMLDVPQDLTENWVMIPCPTGNRVRLISGWGETRAYSRKGRLHSVFPSALPGGYPDSDPHQCAAVDCIWIKSRKIFYILDAVFWSLLPFTNCEAEFRLFWIKNKFQETPEFKERNTDTNKYPILTLQNIDFNSDYNSALMSLDDDLKPLDGFLFYHRRALYMFGVTPLVTWLKPFMLPEVLGISVPSPLDQKPDDYINFEHYMQKVKAKSNQDTTKDNVVTDAMEIEGVEGVMEIEGVEGVN